mmetsp:Transcript_42013/g.97847  ORF Transcript_42013/g.97847 Transcript_42013/m.97847 type:complete len:333 (-) Transcript_42013:61-1059(-)
MVALLSGKPPPHAPWARFTLKGSRDRIFAEIKTDWDPDDAVRRGRRGFFDCMVQAMKQLPVVTFEQSQKRWEITGGAPAVREVLKSISQLGFDVDSSDVSKFLGEETLEAKAPPAVLDDDDELLGWLERFEASQPSETPQSTPPPANSSSAANHEGVQVGQIVQIAGVSSHPQLNGATALVEEAEGERWRVAIGDQRYSLMSDKLVVLGAHVTTAQAAPEQPATVSNTQHDEPCASPEVSEPVPKRRRESQERSASASTAHDFRGHAAPLDEAGSQTRTVPECTICFAKLAATVFSPCGHMVTCEDCGPSFEKKLCPICRRKVKKAIRTYLG